MMLIIAVSSSAPRSPRSPLRKRSLSVGASAAMANAPANESWKETSSRACGEAAIMPAAASVIA